MADTAYPALTATENIFKSLVWDPVIKSAQAAVAGASWATIPVVGPALAWIANFLIGRLSGVLFAVLVKYIDVGAIKLVNQVHQDAYDAASEKLEILAHEVGMDSPQWIAERDAAATELARFTHLGP